MAKKRPQSSAPEWEEQGATRHGAPGADLRGEVRDASYGGGLARTWDRLRDFAGASGEASYLWPRWLVLRAVGIVFLVVFGGIIGEAQALIAPNGIAQLAEFFQSLQKISPNGFVAFWRAPSLFWLSSSPTMISLVAWAGMGAAIALVLNLWPRLALFVAWLCFLSFTTTWRAFSPAQLDGLMLEAVLLCIPFAPAGFRPRLGAHSPPRVITVLMMRWLLFRVMFESGVVKLAAGDPHWRDFSAMDVMYETAPFPTIFGWWDHQLPRWYHVGEIVFTFVAELIAPLAAVFGGRRGRWFAFVVWTILQVGIELTSNFGWLNVAAIGLGLLWLDDQMLAALAARCRWPRLAGALARAAHSGNIARPALVVTWRHHALRVALWAHFYVTLIFGTRAAAVRLSDVPEWLAWPANLVRDFHSANGYYLYAAFEPVRFQVEFLGSNDGGRTWRPYRYNNIPQAEDEICGFIAPRFSRFEATLELEITRGRKSPVYPAVAAHLLAGNPQVVALFRANPFPEGPPTAIRMRGYRLAFTEAVTRRQSGRFWTREPAGDYLAPLYRDQTGNIAEFSLTAGDALLRNGDFVRAREVFEQQYRAGFLPAGFRLAEMLARGSGGGADAARAFQIYAELANEGEVAAEHHLGVCYEFGLGVPIDYRKAAAQYRQAAAHDYLPSLFSLGLLHASDRIVPRDDVTGLALLLESVARATGDTPAARFIRENEPAQAKRLTDRMTAADIARAKERAALKR
jgi:TPR repeat protein